MVDWKIQNNRLVRGTDRFCYHPIYGKDCIVLYSTNVILKPKNQEKIWHNWFSHPNHVKIYETLLIVK
jgi:hypothetical protein